VISERKLDPWKLEQQVKQIERGSYKHVLEKRVRDLALWYYKNQPRIADENLPKRVAFLERTMELTLEALAEAVIRIQHAERHPASPLLLPTDFRQ
jgi:hypothetical protein